MIVLQCRTDREKIDKDIENQLIAYIEKGKSEYLITQISGKE